MSLILDALKKLEQEKVARRARQADLRPAITGGARHSATPRWRLPLLVAGAVILAVAVTIAVMGVVSRRQTPESAVSAPAAPRADASPPVVIPPPAPVVAPSTPPPAPLPLVALPPAPVPQPVPKAEKAGVRPFAEPEPATQTAAPADLKVTGIAWQDERKARRAVVNGSLAGEGAVISGARIIEIRQEQVRFSRDGATFIVPITSSFSGK